MRWLAMSLIGWLSLGLCQGSEIVAWKMPIRILQAHGVEAAQLPVLAEPPEPSVFFHPGDRLHRLEPAQLASLLEVDDGVDCKWPGSPAQTEAVAKAPQTTDPPPEWMVWNASTGYLVTKSDPNAYLQLLRRLPVERGPMQIRVTLSGYPLTDANKEPSSASKPLFQVACLTRSGEESSIDTKNPGGAFALELSPVCDEVGRRVDCRLSGTFRCEGHAPLEIHTAFTATTGLAVWIARDFGGGKGFDIQACLQAEFIDGTPVGEAVLIQKGGKAAPCGIQNPARFQSHQVDESHWLASIGFRAEDVAWLCGHDQTEPVRGESNPFQGRPEAVKEVAAPAALRGWYPQPVWDLRDAMKRCGIPLQENDFAGFDPGTSTAFLYVADQHKVEMFEALLTPLDCGWPSQVIVVWDLLGQSRIVCRSGELARISRIGQDSKPDQEPLRRLEVEPVMGEDNSFANLRIEAAERSRPESHFSITSAHTIQTNQWKTIAESDTKDGRAECRVKMLLSE